MKTRITRLGGDCMQLIPSATPGYEPIMIEIRSGDTIEVDPEIADLWISREQAAWREAVGQVTTLDEGDPTQPPGRP